MKTKYWPMVIELRKTNARMQQLMIRHKKDENEIQQLREKCRSLGEAIALLHSPNDHSMSQLTLTESILEVLKQHTYGLSVSDILAGITGAGFEPKSSDPYTSVYVVCTKLSRRGLIKESTELGKRVFSKI